MFTFLYKFLLFWLQCVFLGTLPFPNPVFLTEKQDVYILPDKKIHDKVPLVLLPGKFLSAKRPTIGVLLARSDDNTAYQISKDYVGALTHLGVQIRFLTYDNVFEQARALDGLVLVGGRFDSPAEWEGKPVTNDVSSRYLAYETLVRLAHDRNIPLFGTCAGMQIMAGVMLGDKMRLMPLPAERQALHNQDKNALAHVVFFNVPSPLQDIFGPQTMVNSVHRQVIPLSAFDGQDIVHPIATALGDITEAVSFSNHPNWIAVQWHPEILATKGDVKQQALWARFIHDAQTYFSNKENLQ